MLEFSDSLNRWRGPRTQHQGIKLPKSQLFSSLLQLELQKFHHLFFATFRSLSSTF